MRPSRSPTKENCCSTMRQVNEEVTPTARSSNSRQSQKVIERVTPDRRRLRVGDYRIIYTIDNGELVVYGT